MSLDAIVVVVSATTALSHKAAGGATAINRAGGLSTGSSQRANVFRTDITPILPPTAAASNP